MPQSIGSANPERLSGLAEIYEQHRPKPPSALCDVLMQLVQTPRPQLVVDLGSGTGLSSFIWAKHAEAVIGIEPNGDMRRVAARRKGTSKNAINFHFQAGLSTQTGLSDNCADIVTCAQAFHWMEPVSTLREVARILRPGGVFAAYDYLWPPTMQWEAEIALMTVLAQAGKLEFKDGRSPEMHKWPKDEHLSRIRASGHFRYVKEFWLHHVEMGSAERLVGLALTIGAVGAVLKHGFSESEVGLDNLRAAGKRVLDKESQPWYFSYHVRVGIK